MSLRLLPALLMAFMVMTSAAVATEVSVTVKGAKGELVADAVVSLIPIDGTAVPSVAATAEIGQQEQEYTSYVTVVQTGARVVFPNKDTVQHHVYSLSKPKKFELPLYNPGQAESFVFDVPGLITLGCNIHDWMVAYLLVVPTPYFAKTDAEGQAQVSAPAGRYRLELWHPRAKANISQEITLSGTGPVKRELALTLSPDRRIRRGLNAKSGGY